MRVTHFAPASSHTRRAGLAPIDMPRLGHVVVLAGRNGSGKTRTLSVLQEVIKQYAAHWSTADATLHQMAQNYRLQSERQDAPPSIREASLSGAKQFVEILETRSKTTITAPLHGGAINYTPSSGAFLDPSQQTRAQHIRDHASAIAILGMDKVNSVASIYIDHVASLSFNASNPMTTARDDERSRYLEDWAALRRIVENLLPGAELGRNAEGNLMLFGRVMGSAELSDGQRALLRVAVALHAQAAKLDEAIVILDEPENHLHPDVLIEFIDRLIQAIPNGQIWIATHSIHVLSFVDPESLWFVEGGKISWAGRQPEQVLRSLVGNEERVGRLERFIHLPSVLAMERFAAECLVPPAIVTTGAEDRQSRQVHEIIGRSRLDDKPLRVLDYGAGRGRILATLRQNSTDLAARIDYRAFEPYPIALHDCVGAVADAYGIELEMASRRVYPNEDVLRQSLSELSVDVVVMCNVLHEIEPSKWRRLFCEQILSHCLKPNGHLLLLEDMKIPHGENAHKYGFILLDTEQLQTLFSVDREDPEQFTPHGDERLKAHLIRADCLKRVTEETVHMALERRLASAGDRIQALREGPATFATGHLLALYTMIYANTALALR